MCYHYGATSSWSWGNGPASRSAHLARDGVRNGGRKAAVKVRFSHAPEALHDPAVRPRNPPPDPELAAEGPGRGWHPRRGAGRGRGGRGGRLPGRATRLGGPAPGPGPGRGGLPPRGRAPWLAPPGPGHRPTARPRPARLREGPAPGPGRGRPGPLAGRAGAPVEESARHPAPPPGRGSRAAVRGLRPGRGLARPRLPWRGARRALSRTGRGPPPVGRGHPAPGALVAPGARGAAPAPGGPPPRRGHHPHRAEGAPAGGPLRGPRAPRLAGRPGALGPGPGREPLPGGHPGRLRPRRIGQDPPRGGGGPGTGPTRLGGLLPALRRAAPGAGEPGPHPRRGPRLVHAHRPHPLHPGLQRVPARPHPTGPAGHPLRNLGGTGLPRGPAPAAPARARGGADPSPDGPHGRRGRQNRLSTGSGAAGPDRAPPRAGPGG